MTLVSEGTYPHSFGGVSVWCDQLVRGLPDYRFHLVSLVGGGSEQPAWQLPGNIASLTSIALWGASPGRGRPRRGAWPRFEPLLWELMDCLLTVHLDGAARRFGEVMRGLFDFAQRQNLSDALRCERSIRLVSSAWPRLRREAAGPVPSMLDVTVALQLLEHSLRPLSYCPARAQVVHCVTNGLAVLPALAAKWTHGTPILLTEHGIYLRERYLGYRRSPYRWPVKVLHLAFLRLLCALAYTESATIAAGNVYNRQWEQHLGADPGIIRTVYNGVDPAEFPAIGGEPDIPTVSWAGRIDPIKDLETLLRAFSMIHRDLPEARLRIFGGTPKGGEGYLERCRRLAAELGIGAAVSFEGRVERIRDAYAAGHVVMLSSISEGFPYTLIEAMTCGKACVATEVGGVSEALGDTGLVVAPRDPAAMAQACLTLLRDPALRQRLGAAARSRALESFTVDRAIGTFGEIYTGLASGRPLLAGPAR
ncbi:MAG TPA: GT4 family glycosyltransferase PelF [Pseudonocardiaceae bacterium]|nr:GT4 family glycosyltransferase PelF [Pseudonocardiaceae bacterium]